MGEVIVRGKPPAMPSLIPRRLTTSRLLLRCPRLEDGPALHEIIVASVDRLYPWFAWPAGAKLTLKRSTATVRFARWRFLAGRELQFYIFHNEHRHLLGVAGLCNPNWSRRHFEIGYWLRTCCEGRGYASEAVSRLTGYAFRRLGARRLEIRCDPDNEATIALPLRLGHVLEKVLPGARRDPHTSTWRDVAVLVRVQPHRRMAPWPAG